VRIRKPAADFGALDKQKPVRFFNDLIRFHRAGETRPAGPGRKFIRGAEQGFPGNDIDINAFFIIIPIRVVKRTFRGVFLGDPELQVRQLLFQLVVGQSDDFFLPAVGRSPSCFPMPWIWS